MSLSKEKQIEIVISHKKHIVELTNKVLEIAQKTGRNQEYNDSQKLQLKQLVNEIISELSIIAGFCSNEERNWVLNMAVGVDMFLSYGLSILLEDWCTMANTVAVDFNKTPFRFFGADLKLKWNQFEARIKGIADRREANDETRM